MKLILIQILKTAITNQILIAIPIKFIIKEPKPIKNMIISRAELFLMAVPLLLCRVKMKIDTSMNTDNVLLIILNSVNHPISKIKIQTKHLRRENFMFRFFLLKNKYDNKIVIAIIC